MNVRVLQELKPYSIRELESIFKLRKNELNNVLKSLSLMNITKRLSYNISKIELEELLELDNIDNLNIQLEGDMYVFKYVGMLMIGNVCLIIYPKYVKEYKDDRNKGYKMLKQLIAVIRKYQSKEQKIGFKYENDIEIDNFNLFSITLELITDYLEHGLYRNDRQVIEQNGEGEIIWDKTINETTAYFSNESPIYLETFTINQENNEKDYFRRLHAVVLTQLCNTFKDILSIINIENINVSFESVENFGNVEYIIYRLNQEIATQFVTYKQNVLQLIKKYLIQENNKSINEYISFIGTNSFNLVWEDVCSVVMNDCINKSIKELGLTYRQNKKDSALISDVIDKPIWIHNKSNKVHKARKTLTPDIIAIDGDSLSIYDAKYYKIRLDENEVKNQPGVGDVTKQYLYELAYKEFAKENNLEINNNAFLMPTDNSEKMRIGIVKMDIFNSIENIKFKDIEIIMMPCEKMYNKYLDS